MVGWDGQTLRNTIQGCPLSATYHLCASPKHIHRKREGGREGWRKSEIQETRSIIFYYTIQTHGDIETIMISTAVNSLPYLSTFCEPFNVGSDSITSYSNVFPESKNRHFPLECHTIIIHY